jgi:hypothetical protein
MVSGLDASLDDDVNGYDWRWEERKLTCTSTYDHNIEENRFVWHRLKKRQ